MAVPQDSPRKRMSYRDLIRIRSGLGLAERTATFTDWILEERAAGTDGLQYRRVLGPMDRVVTVQSHTGPPRPMLMFGSNNYLGLATHPTVVRRVQRAVAEHGAGVGGPPALNGHGPLHRELEERLADLEGQEAALLYGSGYAANVGLLSALPAPGDLVIYDAHSHASFIDGIKLGRIEGRAVPHGDLRALEAALAAHRPNHRDVFVNVEGVYSMTGDVSRLDRVAELCRRYDAALIVDDAHGTGVTGPGGRGTLAMFDACEAATAVVGTFSKSFAVSGGFVAASRAVVEYLRYFSRAYVFSASPSPAVCAAVLAGLDVIEQEPEIHGRLVENAAVLADGLRALGFEADGVTPIFSLPAPPDADVRAMAHAFDARDVFVNHVEAPVVPAREQRFRLSVSAVHTRADIERLLAAVAEVWAGALPFCGDGAMGGTLPDLDEPTLDAYQGGF
ncbi:aminotransferase class I/II-fold pyridoxal phosphate-dependent enzyme [Rubrivirga sp. IMCC45206]|uniref:aminotransferase class I/II-fold pyridoxal phosphate-dependent enzyme n=1 Tax=Rubrivirga sp. IMCC45206 TaxID=3391614 RepID=UPI00398FFA47